MKILLINSPKYGEFKVFVDDNDFAIINKFKWYINAKGSDIFYVHSKIKKSDGKKTMIKLHRFIMDMHDSKIIVDHIDGNTLNNVKSNLRIATLKQNTQNQKCAKNNTTGFKGVSYRERLKKYEASVQANGVRYYIGAFDTASDASKAYDDMSKKLCGEFHRSSFCSNKFVPKKKDLAGV